MSGGVHMWSINGTLSNSTFIGNHAIIGGAASLTRVNINLSYCTFINNTAGNYAGAVCWYADNGTLTTSTFTNNNATINGGAIYWGGLNGTLSTSTFISNHVTYRGGGAINWQVTGTMINCIFNTNEWNNNFNNGIYVNKTLNINGGKGLVNIVTQETLSGISIVVLNNETYYYPPNSNINLTKKKCAIISLFRC